MQISPMCVLCLGEVGRGVDPKCCPAPLSGQALTQSLKSNGSLAELDLGGNNIGDRGTEVPVAECLPAGVGE